MASMKFLAVAALTFATFTQAASAAPTVVVSIKPLHSLVASIMKGIGDPELIVAGAASPHTYNLKPSNADALQEADVVFWVGHGLEAFLDKPLMALAGNAKVVEMDDIPGLDKLAFREGGPFDHHDDDDHDGEAEHAEEHGGYDLHLWLDPTNAKAMARQIETTLVAVDPDNAETYHRNATALRAAIDAVDAEAAALLKPVSDKPSVVFHDAYQYFEHRYHVRVVGSVTVSPENLPGAERIAEIQAKVRDLKAVCIFAEPQFESSLLQVVAEGSTARFGVLDPLGTTLADGPDLYVELIRNLATAMRDCLSG